MEKCLETSKRVTLISKPHLVILGAGASIAAIPNGDKQGKTLPSMDNFIDTLGLLPLLKGITLEAENNNIEVIFSEISKKPEHESLVHKIELKIYDYFKAIEIPDEPTIYDLLLLSLRKKDAIATFNWDPLLVQAYQRAARITKELPNLRFLHGNVEIGTCDKHQKKGFFGNFCSICKKKFSPSKILYPIENKNYTDHWLIKTSWNNLVWYLKNAYMLTIFGYSAPKTDKAALDAVLNAWETKKNRYIEQIEIIDIKSKEELLGNWQDLINSHHFHIHNNFFNSFIACFPRRTCEKLYDQNIQCEVLDFKKGIKDNMSFEEVKAFFEPILREEFE